jgi:hypothetical protein
MPSWLKSLLLIVIFFILFASGASGEIIFIFICVLFILVGIYAIRHKHTRVVATAYMSGDHSGQSAQLLGVLWILMGVAGLGVYILDIQPLKSQIIAKVSFDKQQQQAKFLPELTVKNSHSSKIIQRELSELGGKPLSKLARKNFYTLVEVWIDGDAKCRQIERYFSPLLAKRNDFIIQRVELVLNASDSSMYDIKYIPHIEIYGPDRKVIAADGGNANDGSKFLKKLIKNESL